MSVEQQRGPRLRLQQRRVGEHARRRPTELQNGPRRERGACMEAVRLTVMSPIGRGAALDRVHFCDSHSGTYILAPHVRSCAHTSTGRRAAARHLSGGDAAPASGELHARSKYRQLFRVPTVQRGACAAWDPPFTMRKEGLHFSPFHSRRPVRGASDVARQRSRSSQRGGEGPKGGA